MATATPTQRPPRTPATAGAAKLPSASEKSDKPIDTTPDRRPAGIASAPTTLSLRDVLSIAVAVIGLIATFIFGAWAIRSYNAAEAANELSAKQLQAAQDPSQLNAIQSSGDRLRVNSEVNLALLCATLGSAYNGTCGNLLSSSSIASLSRAVYPPARSSAAPSSSSTPSASPPGGHDSRMGLGASVGIIVASIVGGVSIISCAAWLYSRRRNRNIRNGRALSAV